MRGFDFCPHFIIRSTPPPPPPPPPTPGPTARYSTHLGRQRATSKKSIDRSEENWSATFPNLDQQRVSAAALRAEA